MKKFIMLLAIGLSTAAHAQVAATMQVENLQMRARITTVITGLTVGQLTVLALEASDNLTGFPVVGAKSDSFIATASTMTRVDTVSVSVPFPWLYFFSGIIRQWSGGIMIASTAVGDNTGYLLTPIQVMPTMVLNTPVVDSTNVYLKGTFNTGNGILAIKVVTSIGDTIFFNPLVAYAIKDTLQPVIGTPVQAVKDSLTVPIGGCDYPGSLKVYITNLKGTDSSKVIKVRTRHCHTVDVDELMLVEKLPGTVSLYSMTGSLVYKGHVQDIDDNTEIHDHFAIPGAYVVTAVSDNGARILRRVVGIAK